MRDAPAAARFILRARPAAQIAAAGVLGFSLPVVACRSASSGDIAALWLGPDEWLLLAPEAEGELLASSLAVALAGLPHSLVDVGHRQVGLILDGRRAADVLSSGCPLDLDLDIGAFPVGMCTRTVLDKAEIVLWRTGPEAWRLEVWRSFESYVRGKLGEAAREYAAA
jgi:sarcosine oxidase subunit gamma